MTATESVRPRDSFSDVYSDALRGVHCTVRGIDAGARVLPVDDWAREVSHSDRELLRHCRGATLDVGCGPGRMSHHLAVSGHVVLGVDIVREAVDQARRRGVSALRRDVFASLPGEGRWDTVLLADGNIGIGGAPERLLRRARELLNRTGRVVCDLAEPGTGVRLHEVLLVTELKRSRPFPWAEVGPDAVSAVAAQAGLTIADLGERGGRWYAVLTR